MGKNRARVCTPIRLNESPSEKEGKCIAKRILWPRRGSLNESPSEKEGKSGQVEAPNPITGMPQ